MRLEPLEFYKYSVTSNFNDILCLPLKGALPNLITPGLLTTKPTLLKKH